ncbi:M6 family metalloprotease domain-containing protein [Kosmotoga pacifica]|uniref:M6 family metalloprotease domain-containing protein n=1 Tax=Kosmotoga pacifica TaxID=1330330 RepID=UPI00069B894C|nr:M6 family metalloprotease domain-containing protein [Kosmotoga pacifica]
MRILLIALFIIITAFCFSVPAYPGELPLHQPDGSVIYVRQVGDEYAHLLLYEGQPIVKNPETGWWEFASIERNNLVPTGLRAGIDKPFFIQRSKIEDYLSSKKRPESYERTSPIIGTVKFPVILINFSDTATSFELSDFDELFNGFGYSVKDYYLEVSGGLMQLQFTVVGWFTASKTHDYYGYNIGDIDGFDAHPDELVKEAILAADPYLDYSVFDNDGDGSVDAVIVVHQGNGEEASGNPNDIWSHQFYAYTPTNDGVAASRYTIQPETLFDDLNTIGVICHELGHVFGLIDLYDTDYSSDGIGNWGIMGTGSWNGLSRAGDSPAHFSAWSLLKLGWVSEMSLNDYTGSRIFKPVETDFEVYTFDNPDREGIEYFLFENRRNVGYDSALPGEGLIIYHVDEAANQSNDTHRKVDVEEADDDNALDIQGGDRGSPGDPFPGTSGNTSFALHTNPDSRFYDGSAELRLINISAFGSDIIGEIATRVIKKEPSPYVIYGQVETLEYEFFTTAASYTLNASPDIVQSTTLKDGNIKLEVRINVPNEVFNITLEATDTDGIHENSSINFFPFSYLVTNDGVSNSLLIVIHELGGWSESPGTGWVQQFDYYWKWIDNLPTFIFGREITE